MIGIYKITNKLNGKIYIGQSNDILKRWSYYKNPPNPLGYRSSIIAAIQKYGIDNFNFEIIEECSVAELNSKEIYWIEYYDSYNNGYNLTRGGDHNTGESNPNADLTVEDVKIIRSIYNSKTFEHKIDIYNRLFINKCGLRAFQKVWNGETWKDIMPEVYSEENKNFYNTIAKGNEGENNPNAKLSDEEVLSLRERYVHETTAEILKDYPQLSYSGLEKILIGNSYSHLPAYKKRLKKWIIK